ncbi:uncharacterized protein MYCFIDRAFT_39034 [Pseudocercospora fijiensis CIRAD86]|uniref:Uncharacterized protein n=1 Tax=Pseudocercospora fijiensis (strain CIRAD86) TaxID=383855 RepID=M3B1Q7_PSEFD|nr:uncharacterized protein MYCFIDRAFT_39034 [Pseudocercospora fijiensis CIRAD86]EME83347.1 hypothetical protein MYCFIDRAFT_39034 [Pseudocercospora fijiensis CIRAD86]
MVDDASRQLQSDLRSAVQDALSSRRPVIHHLNADTSWLLQIPRPANAVKRGARFYYNILIDPWLQGGQSDVASWFSQQFHATPSAVSSIGALDELIFEIEILASGPRSHLGRKATFNTEEELGREKTLIDAAVVSHEFTDHCHKETLLEIHPDVPVFAAREAARLIQSWKHFRSVNVVNVFGKGDDTDWRSTSTPPLPEWIGISRLLSTDDVLYYHAARHHSAIEPDEDDEHAEVIIYTPHGVQHGDLAIIPQASPALTTLAFLHGLHDVRVGTATGRTALQLNLGAMNGLKAQRTLNARYWLGTHDEIKRGGGLVAWFLQRDVITLKEALEHERSQREHGAEDAVGGEIGKVLDSFDDINWVDLKNGESRVLV